MFNQPALQNNVHPTSSGRNRHTRLRWTLKAYTQAMALAFCGTMATPAMAICTWIPTTGNWSTSNDWSCGAVPGAADSASIAAAKTVTIDSGQSILTFGNAGSVNIDQFGLNLVGGGSTINTGTINVGSAITANLGVSAGHNIDNTGGVINVANGSVVNQFGSSITGGTINTTGTGKLVAFNTSSNVLTGVTLNGTLDLATGTGIERVVGGLTLNGAVDIGNGSVLAPQGNQTIGGNGNIVFADNSGSNRLNVEAGNLTLGNDITVRGNTGLIGQQAFLGGAATLTNNGTIAADVAGGTISLGVNGTVTNNGMLTALNGGTLVLNNSILGNVGSQITVGAGSTILQNGVTLNGVINNAGTGSFRASNSGNNLLDAASLTGVLDLASATGIERVTNGLTLNGTVNIGNNSVLAPQGNQTISGTGNIVFADSNASNRLNVEAGNLTLGSGITMHGNTGVIGQQAFLGGAASLTNNGTIAADVAGGKISLGVNGTVTNNGTLTALNGGTLELNNSIVGNVGSQITVGAGSTILQNGVTLNGVINNAGTGSFRASNSGNNLLDGVSFSGTLDLASATSIEKTVNGLTLNGSTINIANNSVLAPQGNQTIGGTGTIVFADTNANNRLNVEAGNLTLGSNVTVRGERGVIGQQAFVGGAATLTNNGTIQADVAGGAITLQVNGLTTNNGTLAALNGSTLNLNSQIQGNAGSQILAGAGSVVSQNGVTISGVVNTNGTGSFRANNSGNNVLDGVSFSGTLDLASATGIEKTVNGLTLNGATVNIANNSVLAPQGNQTIGGTGTIIFADNNTNNRLNVEAGNLTLGSGVTVRGGNGVIGQQAFVGGAATLTNQGLISADAAGRTITVDINGSVINQGTMQAQNGGQLTINNMPGGVNNSAGTLLADTGSTVLLNGTAITGGSLNSNGSGVFKAANSGNNLLNGVTLNGTLDMASTTSIERISAGGMTLNGTINIGNNSILAPQGNQTIGGTGSIVFADGSGSNRLNVEAGNLVIGSDVTVRGQTGIIGQQAFVGGAANLTNNGTINADAGGTITVNVNGALTNNGTMRAQNGTLTIQDGLTGTGTLQVDPAGVMNLANTPNTQGKLVMGAAGSTLNIGTQNLTITNDYTNVAAGSGNSFDRRAGVSGAGQILAGGDAAQAITGANVTNGNTANATLTLGNMRVGATTFDYQVANTGSTGPSLRGAIQTTANNANLTDARLSGAGVTAGNYNTGAPGSNTGNLGVTFTAANAGTLASLNGQVLNLTSNFSNIADQKLNIVLGAGAAAFNAAVGSTADVTVANQRVGGTTMTALTVNNTAPAGGFTEVLNASFGTNGGAASNNGALITGGLGTGGIAGNASNSTTMQAGVNATTAGAKTGTVTLNYQTNGLGTSGLAPASVGSQTVNVSGNVYQIAQPNPSALPATVNLGNFRAGSGAQSQNINIANTNIAPVGFQEGLAGVVQGTSGAATGTGFTNAAAGASGALQVGLSGIAAGVNSGSVQVQLQSNGITTSGSNGLGSLNLGGSQTVNVTGTGWRLASANTQPATINFGNVLVGSVQSQFLNIQNTATADGFSEKLDASFKLGGTTGDATNNGGSISLLAAGAPNNNTDMSVGINTSTIGGKTGQAIVAFNSNGLGTSGLGITGLADQAIGVLANVQGNVGTLAQPSAVTPNPVNFGSVRINSGAVGPVSLSMTNNAVIGEGLNASIATASTGFAASGSFISLAPTVTNSSALQAQFTGTSTAGHQTGTATVTLVSDGTFNGGVTTSLPSQTVNMNADVYRLANPTLNTPTVNIAARVNDPVSANQAVSITNTSSDIYTEGLKVNVTGASGNAQSNGVGIAITNLAAQGTDNGSIKVGLASTAVAGNTTGQVNLTLTSTGAGTTGAADASVGTAIVNVAGKVYQQAVAVVQNAVDFGIVHVGDSVAARNVAVQNNAPVVALNDTLTGGIGGASGPFSPSGNLGTGVLAGQTDSSNLNVGLNTTAAGIFNGSATVSLSSHNSDMADLALPGVAVQLIGQVNNFANADLGKVSGDGSLSGSPLQMVLDFGNLTQGSGMHSASLDVFNNVSGPADYLDGLFKFIDTNDFQFSGFNPFANLAAGDSQGGFNVAFNALTTLGVFSDTIELDWSGHNASGYHGNMSDITLLIRANVVTGGGNVPEPERFLLMIIGLSGLLAARRRRMMTQH